jgi:hypothetical protein
MMSSLFKCSQRWRCRRKAERPETIEPFKTTGRLRRRQHRVPASYGDAWRHRHRTSRRCGMEALRRGNAFDAGSRPPWPESDEDGLCGLDGVAPLIIAPRSRGDPGGGGDDAREATLGTSAVTVKRISTPLIPADVDVWPAALDRYGTIAPAARPALEIAEGGYHLYKHQKGLIDAEQDSILRFPTIQFWFPNASKPTAHDHGQPGPGKPIRYMIGREEVARSGDRARGSARHGFVLHERPRTGGRHFYSQFEDGLVAYEDLANTREWTKPLDDSAATTFWETDGPRAEASVPQHARELRLRILGFNTAEYVIFSRRSSSGWPTPTSTSAADFTRLLTGFTRSARKRAGSSTATRRSPTCLLGDLSRMEKAAKDANDLAAALGEHLATLEDDLSERDRFRGELVLDDRERRPIGQPHDSRLGIRLGRRMSQLNLDLGRERDGARKRLRNTNSPVLVMKDGKPFGTLHSRRRRAAPGDPPGVSERRRLGDVARAGARPAAFRKL